MPVGVAVPLQQPTGPQFVDSNNLNPLRGRTYPAYDPRSSSVKATAAGPASATPGLEEYLTRELTPPDPSTLAAIDAGPITPAGATALGDLDTLLDPAAKLIETGWCRLPDGVGYVAVRTPMPGVSAEMVDWWFDWHPRDALRYRIWCPPAHESTSFQPAAEPGAKPFWGTVHYPVEDVGVGMQTLRIAFQPPSRLGFSSDGLDDPRVGTIVGGFAGDPKRRTRAVLMVHVFLRDGDGLVLRSRFWLGAVLRPDAPAPIAAVAAKLLNRPAVRRRVIPARLPYTLARHCAIEYAHLAGLLPELHARYAIPPA